MTDLELTDRPASSDKKPERLKESKSKIWESTNEDELRLRRRPWWYVSILLILFLYAVSIYFAVRAILKYAEQDLSTTIAYSSATPDKPLAFPAIRICPLSNKKDLKYQRMWWLPAKATQGKTQRDYLTNENLVLGLNSPPYPARIPKVSKAPTKMPTPDPTPAPTESPTMSPTSYNISNVNITAGPTGSPTTGAYDYEPYEGGYGDYAVDADYNYDPDRAAVKEASRNCFTWNTGVNVTTSGNKKDALYVIVDVDLPKRNAKFNVTNCVDVNAIHANLISGGCKNNSKWDAVDSSADAMGIELTLYPQGQNFTDFTTVYIPSGEITKLRMQAKKTNKYNPNGPDPITEWDYESTTSQVGFPSDSGATPQIDSFVANQTGHVALVDQLVYLEIKFGDLSVLEITESYSYESFNAFGDATAIFGFFTGFALWGGMNVAQLFKWTAARNPWARDQLYEKDKEK